MESKIKDEKFAIDFKPVFTASTLQTFIGNPWEKTKIEFLKKFEPFSEYKKIEKKKYPNPILMSPNEKKQILDELDKNVKDKNLKFNDNQIIAKVKEIEDGDLIAKFSQINIKSENTEFGSGLKDIYDTPDSDEEHFKLWNDKDKLEKIQDEQRIRFISTNRGKKLEPIILDEINKTEKKNFIKNKEKKYYDHGSFKICGIIDGIDTEQKEILEIKTRKNFDEQKNTITKKERVQSLIYMKLFECEKCCFVESGPNGNFKKEIIEWNVIEFNKVCDKLDDFTKYARSLTRLEFENLIETYL